MKRICAWCRKELGADDAGASSDDRITHGICARCIDNFDFQQGASLGLLLESIGAPVVAVNAEGLVTAANSRACALIGKETAEIENRAGGVVFECEYARLPEGCGRTVHCSGCAIRRTVMQTHETGKIFCNMPAVLNHAGPTGPHHVPFRISTQKVKDLVLLRVDGMGGEQIVPA